MKISRKRYIRLLILAVPLAALFASIVVAAQNKPESAIEWRTDTTCLQEAARASDPECQQLILLRFSASWCMPCRIMDAQVWPNDAVETMVSSNYLPIELDIDRPEVAVLARKYGIRGVPTVILIDASGKEKARANFMGTEQTLQFLKRGVTTAPSVGS